MERLSFYTLLILLFTTFAFADDPPSQTIGEYYTLSVYGGTGNDFSNTVIDEGDDDTHPCVAKLHSYSYSGSGLRTVTGFLKENETTTRHCSLTNQSYSAGWVRSQTTGNIYFDIDCSYSLNIEIENGAWGAIYQFNIHEPETGSGSE